MGRFEFFHSCFQRLTNSRFQVLPLQNVTRRQTLDSSPHLHFAQNFNPSHMVAPCSLAKQTSSPIEICSCVRRGETSEFLHHQNMQSLSFSWLFLLQQSLGFFPLFLIWDNSELHLEPAGAFLKFRIDRLNTFGLRSQDHCTRGSEVSF